MKCSKYEAVIKPQLDVIRLLIESGAFEQDIISTLGISRSTWTRAKNEHAEFGQMIDEASKVGVFNVEQALHKRCIGYDLDVPRSYKLRSVYYDENGKRCETERIETVMTKQHVPADIEAIRFYLINKCRQRYSLNPHAIELKRQEIEIRKTEVENREF